MNDDLPARTAARLGAYVAARRKSFDTTQDDLAALAGISVRALSALEAGKPTTRLDIVVRALDALGVDLADAVEHR